jgi:hypothetical protein
MAGNYGVVSRGHMMFIPSSMKIKIITEERHTDVMVL